MSGATLDCYTGTIFLFFVRVCQHFFRKMGDADLDDTLAALDTTLETSEAAAAAEGGRLAGEGGDGISLSVQGLWKGSAHTQSI